MEEEEQIDGREKEEGEKRIEGGCLRGFDLWKRRPLHTTGGEESAKEERR